MIGWDIFDLFYNRWIEFKETWREAMQSEAKAVTFVGG